MCLEPYHWCSGKFEDEICSCDQEVILVTKKIANLSLKTSKSGKEVGKMRKNNQRRILEEDRNMGDEVWAEVKRATKNKGFGGQTKTPAARIVQSRKRDGKRDRCEWGGWLKKECGIRVSEDDPDDKKNVECNETNGEKLLNDHESGVVGIRQAEVGVIKVSVIGDISQRHLLSENPTLANTVRLVETTDDSLETDVEAGLDDDNVSVVNVSGLVEDKEDAVGLCCLVHYWYRIQHWAIQGWGLGS